jgi:hypothetical protein
MLKKLVCIIKIPYLYVIDNFEILKKNKHVKQRKTKSAQAHTG